MLYDFVIAMNLTVIASFFCIGLFALLSKVNLIKIVIALELIGKSATLSFILGGFIQGETGVSQAIVFTIIVIEVIVAAMALSLVIINKRFHGTIQVDKLEKRK